MPSIPAENLRYNKKLLEITNLNYEKMIGTYESYTDEGYNFLVFKDGKVQTLFIPIKDYDKFNVIIADNYIPLDDNSEFKNLERVFLLNSENRHNIKLLGYSESLDEDDETVCDKVFFQIHDKYVEISVLYIDKYCNYASVKESYSPYDFDFYDNDDFNIYTPYDIENPNKPSLAITPQKLTGKIFAENHEVVNFFTEYEISKVASSKHINGINYGGVDLLVDNEIFVGRFYFNYKNFRTVSKEKFLETIFGIKQIENNEPER